MNEGSFLCAFGERPDDCAGSSGRFRMGAFRIFVLAVLLPAAAVPALAGDVTPPPSPPRVAKVKTSRGVRDLLVYPPATPGQGNLADETPLVLLVSGEGGWRRFDRLLAGWLSDEGYCVGGVSAIDYFWEPQDDRSLLASDFRAYAVALAAAANRAADAPLVLAGFSFGADLAPWIAGAGGWDRRVSGLLMIGPDRTGSLSFRFSEILGFEPKDHIFSVAEALRSAPGVPVAFIHGDEDVDSDAPALAECPGGPRRLIRIAGAGHHFSGRESELRAALKEGLAWIEGGGLARPGP